MEEYIKSTIAIEWVAQMLIHDFKKLGPLIAIERDHTEGKEFDSLLVFQGSFDPPLLSHQELIYQSLSLYRKKFPKAKIALLILLSLSHVEKGTDLSSHSLLGLRIEMFDQLLSLKGLDVPYMIGLSNTGRYIDLTEAIKRYFQNLIDTTYIMGLDVFDKLFQGIYYTKPLKVILPWIFETNYIVAGRDDIADAKEFNSYLHSLPSESQNMIRETEKITFLPLPKKFHSESATRVRKQLFLDQSIQIPSLHPHTLKFIQDTQLYTKNKTILVQQIIIQIFVRKMLEYSVDLNKCVEQTQNFISECNNEKKVQSQILREYRDGNNQYLKKRCYELLTKATRIT
ncbi:MAG: hypothetical protein ACW98F_08440 [Candidatus Hodarchaeales archaeon]|jgi:nicotinic acid mononucleotide adenylyltransferase